MRRERSSARVICSAVSVTVARGASACRIEMEEATAARSIEATVSATRVQSRLVRMLSTRPRLVAAWRTPIGREPTSIGTVSTRRWMPRMVTSRKTGAEELRFLSSNGWTRSRMPGDDICSVSFRSQYWT